MGAEKGGKKKNKTVTRIDAQRHSHLIARLGCDQDLGVDSRLLYLRAIRLTNYPWKKPADPKGSALRRSAKPWGDGGQANT